MKKEHLLKKLAKFKSNHQQKYGIQSLGIFGSYSRGEAQQDSDVDIVVQLVHQDLF